MTEPMEVQVRIDEEVITARQRIRTLAQELGFSLLDQTRIVTAASELARNLVIHGGGGRVLLERLPPPRPGIRLTFQDQGPGIGDVQRAVEEGFSTVGSLGMGIPGAKRLVDEFHIDSTPGQGTTVTIVKYLPR